MKKILIALLFLQLAGCGYFLYPERVGQRSGNVDPAVVILDAAGLLFGVLPGVVAFAVDLTTGTIYLPPGGTSAVEKHTRKLSQSDAEQRGLDTDALARELTALTGQAVNADQLIFYRYENYNTLVLAETPHRI